MNPLVSIVIPSFNQGAFLEEAIFSVLEQTYAPVELLVMDGGSTDGSVSILEKHSDRISFWQSRPDQGQTDAINQGFQKASGEYAWWLNSDDALLPDSVSAAVAFLEEHPDVDLVYGDLIWINEAGDFLREYRYQAFDFRRNIRGWIDISQAGGLARHSALQEIGYLDPSFHYLMDRDVWIRLALNGSSIHHLPRPMARFRIHEASKTQSGSPRAVEERYWTTETALEHPVFAGDPAARRQARARTHAASARVYMKCGEYRKSLAEVWKTAASSFGVFFTSDIATSLAWSLPGLLLGHARITRMRQWLRSLRFHTSTGSPRGSVE